MSPDIILTQSEMADKMYTISRESAAKILNISTRTIDRYIRSGKLTYKKVANKVILAKDEIEELMKEFAMLRQEVNTEIIGNQWEDGQEVSVKSLSVRSSVEASLDAKIDKFFEIFNEKDRQLEDKNKVIFMLQQRLGELETKIQHMVALPDFTQEKQKALMEKEKLEQKIRELWGQVKNEQLKNIIYIGFIVIGVVLAIAFVAMQK